MEEKLICFANLWLKWREALRLSTENLSIKNLWSVIISYLFSRYTVYVSINSAHSCFSCFSISANLEDDNHYEIFWGSMFQMSFLSILNLYSPKQASWCKSNVTKVAVWGWWLLIIFTYLLYFRTANIYKVYYAQDIAFINMIL